MKGFTMYFMIYSDLGAGFKDRSDHVGTLPWGFKYL